MECEFEEKQYEVPLDECLQSFLVALELLRPYWLAFSLINSEKGHSSPLKEWLPKSYNYAQGAWIFSLVGPISQATMRAVLDQSA